MSSRNLRRFRTCSGNRHTNKNDHLKLNVHHHKFSNVNSDQEEKTRSKSSPRHSLRPFDFDAGENWTSSRQVANITLNNNNNNPHWPLIVSYPALHAPVSTPFRCYSQKKRKTTNRTLIRDNDDAEADELLVVGETKSVEFVSNEDESRKAANSGCRYAFNFCSCSVHWCQWGLRYLLAVHNKRTGSLSILPVPKAPYILTHTVKALKSIPPSAAPSKSQYLEARNALGEAFGTKKQKATIRAQERNRIDISAMEGVMSYVMDGIEKGAKGLMTAGSSINLWGQRWSNLHCNRGDERSSRQEQTHTPILWVCNWSSGHLSFVWYHTRSGIERPINQPICRSSKSEGKDCYVTLPKINLGQRPSLNSGRGYWQEKKERSVGIFVSLSLWNRTLTYLKQ